MSTFRIRPNSFAFTIILGTLAALPPISNDISIPALLSIQSELRSAPGVVGQSIAVFMLGFAAGQFAAGPVSDQIGRRPVLLAGLFAYCLAAFGTAFSASVEQLIALQGAEGIAAGSCAVLAFAIIRDLFEGDAARSKRSYVTVVFGLAPMLAPTIGAWTMAAMGWRAIFIVISLAGLGLLCAVALGVSESRPISQASTNTKPLKAYRDVLTDRRFTGLAIVNALSYGAMFAYIAGSPIVIMGVLKMPAQVYAGFFACTALSLTAGAWTSGRCASAGILPGRLLWMGLTGAVITSGAMCGTTLGGTTVLPLMIPLLLVNLFCRGLVAPNVQHMALDPLRENAGTAAAAIGVMQILTGAAAAAMVGFLVPRHGLIGMASVMAALASISLLLWGRASRQAPQRA
jgi:DHA1 family bicyclomycin/chloramphenicol resistance-like MFS transporter